MKNYLSVKILILVLFSLNGALVLAQEFNFEPPFFRASWSVESSLFDCRVSQQIPGFGEARFQHRAGEALGFQLIDFSKQLDFSEVALSLQPAIWNDKDRVRELGAVDLGQGLSRDMSLLLMSELRSRMMPEFQGMAAYDPEQNIKVLLSPINFAEAFEAYQVCALSLLSVNFDQVQRSTLYWELEVRELNDEAKVTLERIAVYANADPSILSVEVASYTDTSGSNIFNQEISEDRAENVVSYLVAQGVEPSMIVSTAHGESREYLIHDPETSEAMKNENRRVIIVLSQR